MKSRGGRAETSGAAADGPRIPAVELSGQESSAIPKSAVFIASRLMLSGDVRLAMTEFRKAHQSPLVCHYAANTVFASAGQFRGKAQSTIAMAALAPRR